MFMKIYLLSILIFYLGLFACITRLITNKLKQEKDNSSLYTIFRMIVLSIIPIVNTLFSIAFIYFSIIMEDETFIKKFGN